MAATKSNLHAKFGAEKQFAAVEHTRDIGKKNMIHNNATPDIEVDPKPTRCAPAEVLSMAQRYFLF